MEYCIATILLPFLKPMHSHLVSHFSISPSFLHTFLEPGRRAYHFSLRRKEEHWQKYLAFVVEVIIWFWFRSVDIYRMFVNRLGLSSCHAALISENSVWWLQSSRKRTHKWSGFYVEIWHWMVVYGRCAHTFKESRSHFKILAARRMTWSTFHIKDPHILFASIQN